MLTSLTADELYRSLVQLLFCLVWTNDAIRTLFISLLYKSRSLRSFGGIDKQMSLAESVLTSRAWLWIKKNIMVTITLV